MRIPTIILTLALAAPCFGQTTGVIGANDFTVNGAGSGTTSGSGSLTLPAGPQIVDLAAAVAAGDQVLLAGGNIALGLLNVNGTDTLDIDLSAGIIYDSLGLLGPGPAFPFATGANSAGNWALSFSADLPGGLSLALQLGLFGASHPAGVAVSQAQDLLVPLPLCPNTVGGDIATVGDDTSHNFVLNTGFTFYGTVYSDLFVNSNGNITFGIGENDFTSSEAEMLSNAPRIAPAWDDFSPNVSGSVRTFDDGATFEVEWNLVPTFGCATSPDNTFCAVLDQATNDITMLYAGMGLCNGASTDILVGVSPGGGLSLANNGDLWSGVPAFHTGLAPLDAAYEDFSLGAFGPFDLGLGSGNSGISITSSFGSGPYGLLSF